MYTPPKILIIVFLCFASAISAFAQTEKEAFQLLQNHKLTEAERAFHSLLDLEKPSVATQYGYAKTLLNQILQIKSAWKPHELKLRNFSPELEKLERAYQQAQKASSTYAQLSAPERERLIAVGVTNGKDVLNLPEGIAQTSADILLKAPYNIDYRRLSNIEPYNEIAYADTTLALRNALIRQMSKHIDFYDKSRTVGQMRNARKSLLSQFISLQGLRVNGTGSGYLYETHCDCIIESFTEKELEHILPQFYGADYQWKSAKYQESESYKKLLQIAQKNNVSILELYCHLNLHDKGYQPKYETLYDDFISRIAPLDIAFVALQRKAGFFLKNGQADEALQIYAAYRDLFPKKLEDFNKIIALLKAPQDDLKLENLGATVNSPLSETHPVADNEHLYFCRTNLATGQDIMVSEKQGKNFEAARPLPINTQTHEVPQSISADGNTLVIFGNYSEMPDYQVEMRAHAKELGNGDVYFVERKGAFNWSRIRPFPTPINTVHYESSLSFSADGKVAFFVSDRPRADSTHLPKGHPEYLYFHGREAFKQDLYVVEKEGAGWGEPQHMGEVLNTDFAESMPFLHPDGKTLYFISDGHYNLGGADVFMSKRLSDKDWTSWSAPVNLGKSINSPDDDGFYLDASGEFAYLVLKDRPEGYGSYDLYRFVMPERFRPEALVSIKGKITDDNGHAISGNIVWEDLESGQREGSTMSLDGNFELALPRGKHYGIYAEGKGKIAIASHLNTKEKSDASAKNDIKLLSVSDAVAKSSKIRLNNIFFDFDSYTLQRISFPELRRLVDLLKSYPELSVRIEGHTDDKGNAAYNLKLSQNRAEAVRNHLILMGIAAERIEAQGFGKSQPISDNQTEAGRALNRRVEFSLSK
ncbi:MAG: OmpA family protein [Bernardetiaceae bacterium]|nr:OmpA family protein [Bernardetiaceae bacterium]